MSNNEARNDPIVIVGAARTPMGGFQGDFDGVTAAIRAVLDGLEVILIDTPWPVVMVVILGRGGVNRSYPAGAGAGAGGGSAGGAAHGRGPLG